LLDADFPSVHNTSVITESLEAAGGWCKIVQGTLCEVERTEFITGLDLSVIGSDEDSFRYQLEHIAMIVTDTGLATSMIAANCFAAIEHQPLLVRAQSFSTLSNYYYSQLQSFLSQFEMDFLFSVEETALVRAQRFGASIGKLLVREMDEPYWPINLNPLEPETAIPPSFDEDHMGSLAMFGERLAASVMNLPPLGRLLQLKLAQIVHYRNSVEMTGYFNAAFVTGAAFTGPTASLQSYFMDVSLKDGKDSNAERLLRRFSYLAVLRTCQTLAFQRTLENLRNLISVENLLAVDATKFSFSDFSSNCGIALRVVENLVKETRHPVTKTWVFTSIGKDRLASKKGTDAVHALHFLNAQMKDKTSLYHMPDFKAPQKNWDDWFSRIASLKTTYTDINDSVVIPMLLSHLRVDDKRILGWSEACKEAESFNKILLLEDFLSHVKRLVIPTGTLRRDAAKQLLQITTKPFHIADCQTLGSKILLLFRALYPPNSDEVEPLSRITAMKHVHSMLQKLKEARLKDSSAPLVTAWMQFTGYQHFDMFIRYIDEQLHTSNSVTIRLCEEYISLVVNQLTVAHRMYVQMQSVLHTPQFPRSNNTSNTGIGGNSNTGTGNGHTHTGHRINAVNTGNRNDSRSSERNQRLERSRSRSGVSGSGGSTTGTPPGSSAGQYGRGSNRGRSGGRGPGRGTVRTAERNEQRPKYVGAEHEKRLRKALKYASQSVEERYKPGWLRHQMDSGLSKLNEGQVFDKMLAGTCLLCQVEGHRASNCPHFAKASEEVKSAAKQMRAAFFDKYYGDE
jgi:hypothetical protein